MPNKTFTAMGANYCPVCATKVEGTEVILLDERLRDSFPENTTNRPVFMDWEYCSTHKTQAKQGYIFLIEIDPKKSDKLNLMDVHRTGCLAAIKPDAFERIFNQPRPKNEFNIGFIDEEGMRKLEQISPETSDDSNHEETGADI